MSYRVEYLFMIWFIRAWNGDLSPRLAFLLLVVLPIVIVRVLGKIYGHANLFAYGYLLHPALSIPFGLFEFLIYSTGLICFWRSISLCQKNWKIYLAQIVAVGIAFFHVIRLIFGVLFVLLPNY